MKTIFRTRGYKLLFIILQIGSVAAVTEKTFLSNAPYSNAPTSGLTCYIRDAWIQNLELKGRHDCGGRLLLRSVYRQSYNHEDLGRYFGVNNKPNVVIGQRLNEAVDPVAIINATTVDIDERFIIHTGTDVTPPASGTVSFRPEHDFFTLDLLYEQSLDVVTKGLSVWISLPFEHVKRSLKYMICSSDTSVLNNLTLFFTGQTPVTPEADIQMPLTNAKLTQSRSTNGLGDIELGVRYDIVNKQVLKLDIGLQGIIPCANKPTGQFLFEPLRGHEGHGAIGFDVHVSRLIYDNYSSTVQFVAVSNANYFFATDQKRTLGIKDYLFGQYVLLGQAGQTKLLPAANVLTMPLRIEGYTELSASCGLNGNHHGWFGSLMYQLKTREEECVKLKDCWNNTKYAVSSLNFEGINPFGSSPTDFDVYANNWITQNDLDVQSATTPGFLLHEFGLVLGKVIDLQAQTILVSAGFTGEFSGRNFPAQSWGVDIGIGISF